MSDVITATRPATAKSAVERSFSQVAANYTVSTVHVSGVELFRMMEVAGLTGGERVLDAGCGPGHTALAFAPQAAQVVAMDLSEAMLEQVRQLAADRRITNVETRLGDVEKLPFGEGEFDIIVSRYSAHHWPNPQRALREFHRTLRDGPQSRGQVILADTVSYDDCKLDTFIQAIELLRDGSHVRNHTTSQWMAMFSGAGFAVELVYEWILRLDFTSWLQRINTPPNAAAMIRSLFDHAPDEIRNALKVEDDYSFSLKGIVLRGVRSVR